MYNEYKYGLKAVKNFLNSFRMGTYTLMQAPYLKIGNRIPCIYYQTFLKYL